MPGTVALEMIKDVLRDRCIAHQLSPAQHLEMARYCGLGQIEHGLEVGHEERCRGQAVEDAQPGRLRDGEQKVGCGSWSHMRVDEYSGRSGSREAEGAGKRKERKEAEEAEGKALQIFDDATHAS